MANENLGDLISVFLQVNPDPSDEQFHSLAQAAGVDHQELEAVAYQMLAESEHGEEVFAADEGDADAPGEDELSDAQDVLDGDYDPNTTVTNDLMLNDGLPAGEDSSTLLQDTTLNDGVSEGDTGAGIADQNMLYSDGLAPIKLGASARLKAFDAKK